jgi:hypothetical protein
MHLLPGDGNVRKAVYIIVRMLTLALSLFACFFVVKNRAALVARAPDKPRAYMIGDPIGPISGLSMSQTDQTLIVAIRSNCRACIASAEFYRRLFTACQASMASAKVRIVMITNEDAETAQRFVASAALPFTNPITGISPSPRFRVLTMPALILTDRSALVTNGWVGELTTEQQAEVLAALCTQNSSGPQQSRTHEELS